MDQFFHLLVVFLVQFINNNLQKYINIYSTF